MKILNIIGLIAWTIIAISSYIQGEISQSIAWILLSFTIIDYITDMIK